VVFVSVADFRSCDSMGLESIGQSALHGRGSCILQASFWENIHQDGEVRVPRSWEEAPYPLELATRAKCSRVRTPEPTQYWELGFYDSAISPPLVSRTSRPSFIGMTFSHCDMQHITFSCWHLDAPTSALEEASVPAC